MKMLVKQPITFALVILSQIVFGQGEFSNFNITGHGLATTFATDYQCQGINPANTAVKYSDEDKRFAIGIGELAFSLHSGVLTKRELIQNIAQKGFQTISRDEQLRYAEQFSKQVNAFDFDATTIGISLNVGKVGSFAFSSRERVDMYSKLGKQVSDLIWLGRTASYFSDLIIETANGNYDTIVNSPNVNLDTLQVMSGIVDSTVNSSLNKILSGTRIHTSWIREFNFSYSRPVIETDNWAVYAGLGAKYLIGQALLDINSQDGKTTANAAFCPLFNLEYDSLANSNPSAISPDASSFTPVGRGLAFDIGATFKWKDLLFASLAFTDIGSMNWNANLYSFSNSNLTELAYGGMNNVNLVDNLGALNVGSDFISWKGESSYKTNLPATMRFGAGLNVLNKAKLGIDCVAPMNNELNNLQKGLITIGGEITLPTHIKISAGIIKGGNYQTTRVSCGISKTSLNGHHEMGIASRDIITYFTQDEPTVSLAFGFLRFKF
jgi:hypothetical protein